MLMASLSAHGCVVFGKCRATIMLSRPACSNLVEVFFNEKLVERDVEGFTDRQAPSC